MTNTLTIKTNFKGVEKNVFSEGFRKSRLFSTLKKYYKGKIISSFWDTFCVKINHKLYSSFTFIGWAWSERRTFGRGPYIVVERTSFSVRSPNPFGTLAKSVESVVSAKIWLDSGFRVESGVPRMSDPWLRLNRNLASLMFLLISTQLFFLSSLRSSSSSLIRDFW